MSVATLFDENHLISAIYLPDTTTPEVKYIVLDPDDEPTVEPTQAVVYNGIGAGITIVTPNQINLISDDNQILIGTSYSSTTLISSDNTQLSLKATNGIVFQPAGTAPGAPQMAISTEPALVLGAASEIKEDNAFLTLENTSGAVKILNKTSEKEIPIICSSLGKLEITTDAGMEVLLGVDGEPAVALSGSVITTDSIEVPVATLTAINPSVVSVIPSIIRGNITPTIVTGSFNQSDGQDFLIDTSYVGAIGYVTVSGSGSAGVELNGVGIPDGSIIQLIFTGTTGFTVNNLSTPLVTVTQTNKIYTFWTPDGATFFYVAGP